MEVKLSENLFLGTAELTRIIQSLGDEGYKKLIANQTANYGLIKDNSNAFTNGKVLQGTNPFTIKVNETKAIDKDLNFIYNPLVDNLTIPNDGFWYWVQISFNLSNIEKGTYSIDSNGNLIGVGSELLTILRGKPDHASKIKFIGSTGNLMEYEVNTVIDDNNAVLSGSFTAESNLQLVVVGTFDPIALDSSDKNIFLYDSSNLTISRETTLNTPPNIITPDVIFNLARVKVISGQVVIQDKRTSYWMFKSEAMNNLPVNLPINPLFGIESVRFDHASQARTENLVALAWSFRSSNFTINSSSNTVTLNGGVGGQFKDTTFFTNGDFDGWKIYTKDGKYSLITSSVKAGSQINLSLDTLKIDSFQNSSGVAISQELILCPNVDEIEIRFTPEPADITTQPSKNFTLPINKGQVEERILCYDNPCTYIVEYRYRKGLFFTDWFLPKNASTYYSEGNFNSNGVFDAGTLPTTPAKTYTPSSTVGFIELELASDSYTSVIGQLNLNDKTGVELVANLETAVASISNRRLDLEPGVRKQTVIITGSDVLTNDVRLNLITTNAKSGTSFLVELRGAIDTSTTQYGIKFYQDNTTVLLALNQNQITKGGQIYKCVYDSDLAVYTLIHIDKTNVVPTGVIVSYSGTVAPFGWAICDGTNGTPDLRAKFIIGAGQGETPLSDRPFGSQGGVERVTLSINEMPSHNHSVSIFNTIINDDNITGGGSDTRRYVGDTALSTITSNDKGNGQSHENMPPYYALTYIMKL